MHIEGCGNPNHKRVTPMKAIKAFCLECQGGTSYEYVGDDGSTIKKYSPFNAVRECTNDECWLFDYRMGCGPKKG